MKIATCPSCHKSFNTAESKQIPFCCERCKDIDLHRWFSEYYAIAGEPVEGNVQTEGRSDDDTLD